MRRKNNILEKEYMSSRGGNVINICTYVHTLIWKKKTKYAPYYACCSKSDFVQFVCQFVGLFVRLFDRSFICSIGFQ